MANRKDLIQIFRERTGLTVRESALCIDAFSEWITETLVKNGSIKLRGIGSFEVKQMSERKLSSMFSSSSIVPARGKIVFRPSEKLKVAVNDGKI